MPKLTVYCPLEVDVPTSVAKALEEKFPQEEFAQEVWMSAPRLYQKVPSIMQWVVKNGYAEFDLIVRVHPKEKENVAQVDEPVAQQTIL
jgi:hypothetical protein